MSESKCATCPSAGGCNQSNSETCNGRPSMQEPANKYSKIKKVIGVVSGKGGVGKSFVTGSLAAALRKAGFSVGIMDADITGPSIPRMFGVDGEAYGNEEGMLLPTETDGGIKLMSINLLMDDPSAPVIWRGPVIGGAVRQFWTDVVWGELDYLFVDMPPGTGDVPLTVFQSLPVDGIIVVTSPQELVQMIVKKAYKMAEAMKIPVLGLIENFSYLVCPDCGKQIEVFGKSQADQVARELAIPVLAKLPLDPAMAAAADAGGFEYADHTAFQEAVEVLKKIR